MQFDESKKGIAEEADARALKNLTSADRRRIDENKKLIKNMNMQKDEVEIMKRDRYKFKSGNQELLRQLEIAEEEARTASEKNYELGKTIKILKEKMKVLDNTVTKISSEAAHEKELLIHKFNQTLKEKDSELVNLKQQIQVRRRELKNIRGLSQMILDQRSDVEQFFLEALEQIKDEVRKKMQAENRSKRLPYLNQEKGKAYSDKVDLNDLDWEDRERVLRLLFAKMNLGVPPTNWRQESIPE